VLEQRLSLDNQGKLLGQVAPRCRPQARPSAAAQYDRVDRDDTHPVLFDQSGTDPCYAGRMPQSLV
jgi:hypothetical protein